MFKNFISFIFLDKEIREDVLFLEKIGTFKMFTTWELKKITGILYRKTYSKNEYVFKRGEPAKMFCLLKKGKIELFDGENKNIIGDNAIFGEKTLLCANDFYSKDAKPIEKSEVYLIHKEDLEGLMEKNKSIGYKIVKALLENIYNKVYYEK